MHGDECDHGGAALATRAQTTSARPSVTQKQSFQVLERNYIQALAIIAPASCLRMVCIAHLKKQGQELPMKERSFLRARIGFHYHNFLATTIPKRDPIESSQKSPAWQSEAARAGIVRV